MERAEIERRLQIIRDTPLVKQICDGYTYSELDELIREIEKKEGGAMDILGIWTYGIDASYPWLRRKYPEVFPGKGN